MLLSLFSSIPLLATCPTPLVQSPGVPIADAPLAGSRSARSDEEFDKRYKAAGRDAEALWDLYLWCASTERDKEAEKVLRRLVAVDPDHREAREKLGHVYYDGQWFTTEKKLETYKRKEAERRAKEEGLVEYEGEWVRPEDVEYLERGLVRDESGRWVTPEEIEKLKAGWVRQDLVWVSPEEIPKMEEGLWKCGDEWLPLAEANRWHEAIGRWWVIPGDHVVAWTTCDRNIALKAMDEMERGYRDVVRAFGRGLARPVNVAILRSNDQFLAFAEGVPALGHPTTDGRGMANSNRSFFAQAWFDPASSAWRGMGATFWDTSEEYGDKYGVHDVRMAMGLSFVEALDPSPKAIEKAEKRGFSDRWLEDFLDEKKLPAWFRWGTAAYASRFYNDGSVGTGGNPWWTREWSVQNIVAQGGLDSLDTIFGFPISGDNRQTAKLITEAGLIVAFMLDGNCEPVQKVHAELKQALKEGADTGKIFDRLRKEIDKHEDQLRAFAKL